MIGLQEEVYRLRAVVEAQQQALAHWRKKADDDWQIIRDVLGGMQLRVASWIVDRIGADHMHPAERAMRLLEEAMELCQAEGVNREMVEAQARHVFSRLPGEVSQEAGGVAVCLLGWCAARGTTWREITLREIERIEAKSADQIRGSLARKQDADLVTVVPDQTNRP